MMLTHRIAHAVAAGKVAVAYRRWGSPRVGPGSTFRTVAGVVRVEAIEKVDPAQIDATAAHAAGFATPERLLHSLGDDHVGPLWCISLSWAGPDPREARAQDAALSPSDIVDIDLLLDRIDAERSWARTTLGRIAANPGTPAAVLAEGLPIGKDALKRRIRTLKEHGLTRNLRVGYELSARGHAYLDATDP